MYLSGVPEQCFVFGPEGDNKELKVPCVPELAMKSFTPSLSLNSIHNPCKNLLMVNA